MPDFYQKAPVTCGTSNGKLRAGRAQQFMPFASLRGFYDMVRQQERRVEPRREHTEEDIERLSRLLAQLEKGTVARITHYQGDAYVISCGAVTEIVPAYKTLRIIKECIAFEDIYEIEILG